MRSNKAGKWVVLAVFAVLLVVSTLAEDELPQNERMERLNQQLQGFKDSRIEVYLIEQGSPLTIDAVKEHVQKRKETWDFIFIYRQGDGDYYSIFNAGKYGAVPSSLTDKINKENLRAFPLTAFEEFVAAVLGKKNVEKISEDNLVLPETTNKKDLSKYSDKSVFIVSDENWQDVLSLLPVAMWEKGMETECNALKFAWTGEKCVYPLLVYHREGEGKETDPYDADSITYFLEQYAADNAIVVQGRELNAIIKAPAKLMRALQAKSHNPLTAIAPP